MGARMTDLYANAHALELERDILAVIWLGRTADAVAIVMEACPTPEHFHDPRHQLIIRTVYLMAADGRKIDGLTIQDALGQLRFQDVVLDKSARSWSFQQGLDPADSLRMHVGYELMGLIGETAGHASGLRKNCETLAAYFRQREMIRTLDAHLQAVCANDGRTKAGIIGDRVINDVAQVLGGANVTQTMDEAMGEALKAHDAARLKGVARIASWGLEGLDRMAPLGAGDLVVLAAAPGFGKTSIALMAAIATYERLGPNTVAIVNMEQTPEQLATIRIGQEIKVSTKAIRAGALTVDQRTRADGVRAKWEGSGMAIKSGGSCTIEDLISWIRQRYLRSGGRLSLVVVDYLQLIDRSNPRHSDYDTISQGSKRLKRIAGELRICVIALSALSRDGRKGVRGRTGEVSAMPEPRKEDLRGSGNIEGDADLILLIWSQAVVIGPQVPVMIKVDKNRHGDVGTVHAIFERMNGQVFRETILAAQTPVAPEDSSRIHHNHPPDESEDAWTDSAAAKAFP